jgi:hypothetical protein
VVTGRRQHAAALLVALAAVVGMSGGPGAAASARPVPRPVDVRQAADEAPLRSALAAPFGGGCGPASPTPVTDDGDLVVTLAPAPPFTVGAVPAAAWRETPVADTAWQLAFRGLMWLPPLARRAAEDRQHVALAKIVDQALAFHRAVPDPGIATRGWDEGTSLRRLTALNCLYQLTADDRLPAAMAAEAAVLTGPRYYGPPHRQVHNHGLMANMALLRAGRLLGRADWTSTALARMRAEAPLAFSPLGTSVEQSSAYHLVNVSLWGQAARAVEAAVPGAPTVAVIRDAVARAAAVSAWLTEPDGRIVLIGDADEQPGVTRPAGTGRWFRDDRAGLGVGRWSWTDPAASYYTVRYGPPLRAHGHQDRGGVTWSPRGVRVLVNPGRYTYEASSRFLGYQDGPAGHNVAVPRPGVLAPRAWVTVTRTAFAASSHRWELQDRLFGPAHRRVVGVAASGGLTVTDRFPEGTRFTQYWHLDPAWRLLSLDAGAGRAVVVRADGRRVTVTSTGRLRLLRGSTRPVAGWYFPTSGRRVPNIQLMSTGVGGIRTTFRLS